jgi:phosphoribosyl-AMP cyclohydrolase
MITLDFEKSGGLIPAIVQDFETNEVLMLAFMNNESWRQTLETGKATYWSRSRQELWVKGNTSGHVQLVREIRIDCDDDTVLLKVEQLGGAACHTGHRTCFHKSIKDGSISIIDKKIFDPKEVYK